MNHLTVETDDVFTSLLELAANNDAEGIEKFVERDISSIDEVGRWYCRQKGSNQMVLENKTPLMVASTYGSIDVIKLILSLSESSINQSFGLDKTTALHCAASGGSSNAIGVVKLLLSAGADPNVVDSNGHRPIDVVVVPPNLQDMKLILEQLLTTNDTCPVSNDLGLKVSTARSNSNSPENGSPLSAYDFISPMMSRKEYPIDPSLPDIKNSIYSTDEFRMYSFKIRPCSRAYSHDWTECPFVHPGENARRRDPRKFHYSCVPCPDFRKGACRRSDMCEYAHGVFECWLHPAQYRTRLCKDGTSCSRRVCFFAHVPDELRPLYVSTGSAVPSPRSDIFTPPISPSSSNIQSVGWPQPNIPMLHLPGNNIQSSRLRSSINARDVRVEDYSHEDQLLNELSFINSNSLYRYPRTNLDDLFSTESLSPRFSDMYSPTHKSAVLSQFQQQQSMLSPMGPNFLPRNTEPMGSPMGSRASIFGHQQFRSLSSRELMSSSISGSPVNSHANSWSNGNLEWSHNADGSGKHRRSSSFKTGCDEEEPDLSWIQLLMKESPNEFEDKDADVAASGSSVEASKLVDDGAVLGEWLERVKFDLAR